MDTDYDDWTIQELRERVKVVQALDALADEMVQQAVHLAQNFTVVEVEISVPQTRTIMIPNS